MSEKFFCNEWSTVETPKGAIRGFYNDGVYCFHGIRYGRARRFHQPEPVEAWEGVQDALGYGYICPLLSNPRPTGEIYVPHRFWPENEDCLFLNVWSPDLDEKALRPVMVWFHGGGYAAGSSIEHICYEGDNLARFGDVVVVSVNHRLNVFGHLDMSMFGEEYANSVNAGIADLVESLKWVRDNITAFGGDPDNVTIFGQSGGGGKVTTLGQVPAAAGLFHKAIVMSGVLSDAIMASDMDPKELVLQILAELKLTEADVKKLETVPTPFLIRATNRAVAHFAKEGKRVNWGPVANGWYLGDPLQVGFSEYYRTVPTMVGTVLGEFAPPLKGVDDKFALSEMEVRERVAAHFGAEHADELIQAFREAYPEKCEVDLTALDTIFRPISVEYVRRKAAESAAPVYCYLFALDFDVDGGRAAWHCADIPFFFANAERSPICDKEDVTEYLESQMSDAFINFARSGDPNAMELPGWKPCTEAEVRTMIFDEECEVRTNFDDRLLELAAKYQPAFKFEIPTDPDEESDWIY